MSKSPSLLASLVAASLLFGACTSGGATIATSPVGTSEETQAEPVSDLSPEAEAEIRADLEDLSPQEVDCMLEAIAADQALAEPLGNGGGWDGLDTDQQVMFMLVAVDCAPETIIASMEQDPTSGGMAGCLIESIDSSNPDRGLVILGWMAMDAGEPVSEEARGPVIESFVGCSDTFEVFQRSPRLDRGPRRSSGARSWLSKRISRWRDAPTFV